MDGPRTSTSTRPGWWWVVPVALAALLVGLMFPTEEQLGGFAVLRWRLWAIPSALVLLALSGWLAIRKLVWQVVFAGVLVSLALLSITFGLWWLGEGDEETYRVRAPDGPGEVVVYWVNGFTFDPPWRLELRWGSGLAERRWDLGCVNSEAVPSPEVEWIARDRLRVGYDYGSVEVTLDGSTGRPHDRVSIGC